MDTYYEILIPERFKKQIYSQETHVVVEDESCNFDKNNGEVTINISQTNVKGNQFQQKRRN